MDAPTAVYTPESVDPTTGEFSFTVKEFSLGSKSDNLGIEFSRIYKSKWVKDDFVAPPFGAGFSHNYLIGLRFNSLSYQFSANFIVGNQGYKFNLWIDSNKVWHYSNMQGDGAIAEHVFVDGVISTVLTTRDGTRYIFPEAAGNYVTETKYGHMAPTSLVKRIEAPNGEQLNFYYENAQGGYENARLKGIRHSRGYGVLFNYVGNASGGSYNVANQTVQSIVALSSTCATFPVGCGQQGARTYTYGYTVQGGNYVLSSSVDAVGSVTSYQFHPEDSVYHQIPLKKVFAPGYGDVPAVEVKYEHDGGSDQFKYKVSQVVIGGVPYGYAYGVEGYKTTTTVTGPLGDSRLYKYLVGQDADTMEYVVDPVTYARDPLGNVTEYEYEWPVPRLVKETNPEGNFVKYVLDSRGNQIETIQSPKPGSTDPVFSSYAHFPECTSGNLKICNNPEYVTDPKGRRTYYTWSTDHGGPLTETSGLDANGNCLISGGFCPLTTYDYSTFTGVDGSSFYLPTSKTQRIDSGKSVTTTYAYDASNHFFLKEEVVDAGGENLRTCIRHDAIGNQISKTLPKAGLAVCP